MEFSTQREKILEEIRRVPDAKLDDLFNLLHSFRMDATESGETAATILRHAGSWSTMSEADYSDLVSEVSARRKQGFARRRAVANGAS